MPKNRLEHTMYDWDNQDPHSAHQPIPESVQMEKDVVYVLNRKTGVFKLLSDYSTAVHLSRGELNAIRVCPGCGRADVLAEGVLNIT